METSWTDQGWLWHAVWHAPQYPPTRVVVAFHGFGRPCDEMLAYLPLYEDGTAMLSVGVAHQNGSHPPLDGPVQAVVHPEHMAKALDAWLEDLVGTHIADVEVELLGYSLGGRVAMALLESHPGRWMGLTLLAPDGFKKNPMYRFAVETAAGRATWAWVDRHAEGIRALIRGLRKVRILPAHLEHFALHHTEDHAMRTLVANTWMTHRKFWPTREGMRRAWSHMAEQGGRVHVVFGDRDAIIPKSWGRGWDRLVDHPNVRFLTISSGHVMRHPTLVQSLKRTIFPCDD